MIKALTWCFFQNQSLSRIHSGQMWDLCVLFSFRTRIMGGGGSLSVVTVRVRRPPIACGRGPGGSGDLATHQPCLDHGPPQGHQPGACLGTNVEFFGCVMVAVDGRLVHLTAECPVLSEPARTIRLVASKQVRNTSVKRGDIKDTVRLAVWARAAGCCVMCSATVLGSRSYLRSVLVGELAHNVEFASG